jgi:hypothetical protein
VAILPASLPGATNLFSLIVRAIWRSVDGIDYQMMGTGAESDPLICTLTTPGADPRSRSGRGRRALTEARREQNRLNQRTYRKCGFLLALARHLISG